MTTTQKKNYALPIAMMFALFAMIAFVTNLCSPMAVIVKNQFDASNFAAQLGNAANFIAYAVMGIPSGMLLKRYGYRRTFRESAGMETSCAAILGWIFERKAQPYCL